MYHNTHTKVSGESDLQQLNLNTALHVILDPWSNLHPDLIQLLEDLQVLKSLVHLQQTKRVINFIMMYLFHMPIVGLRHVQQQKILSIQKSTFRLRNEHLKQLVLG